MSIEIAVHDILAANAQVAALVEARVYPDVLPQAPRYPAVVVSLVSGASDYAQDGPTDLARARVQIDCFAADKMSAIALRNAAMSALSGYRGIAGTPAIAVQGVFALNQTSNWGDGLAPTGPETYRISIDFEIWHEEDYSA